MDNRFDIKSNLLETYNINCITRTITENIGFHGHDFYELEIVLDGKCETVINNNTFLWNGAALYFLRRQIYIAIRMYKKPQYLILLLSRMLWNTPRVLSFCIRLSIFIHLLTKESLRIFPSI